MISIIGKSFYLRGGVVLLAFMLMGIYAQATHLRAGNIIATRLNCNSRTFQITITVYTKSIGATAFFGGNEIRDGDILDFGDNTANSRVLVPQVGPDNTPSGSNFSSTYEVIDAVEGIARATFTITHTYLGPDQYTISYREPNRNGGVLNMDNSLDTPFYLETVIDLDPFYGCSNTPNLLVPPIDQACIGQKWTHNPGAYDPDGDSLSFAFVIPFQDVEVPVLNYKDPNNEKFYTDFTKGNELKSNTPTFHIDAIAGTITWDAPGDKGVGEYNIAFVIKEWRKIKGVWYEIGFVRRDMQIIVKECENNRPDLEIPNDTCVVAGTILDATIFGLDPDNDNVKIEAFSEIFNFSPLQYPATYTPNPPVFQPSDPKKAELKLHWETQCLHIKDQPYVVVFKITDPGSGNDPSLATFKTWFIKVVGPAPEWKEPILDLSKRETKLEWSPYFCGQVADSMQIWRRVGDFPFEPDNCQTGMPNYLGYKRIANVLIKNGNTPVTTYTDNNNGKGLAPGARYCYRLVAVFPEPRGGESYVSLDTCVGPILADVPVITNVSVEKTSETLGEIQIRWQKPFDANPGQFPPPYKYDVWKAIGFTRNSDSTKVATMLNDTTFIDSSLNTFNNVYNYSISCYASDGKFVGTSAAASSVRLETKSQVKKIELNWSAFVPWSNVIAQYPNHVLYRGAEGTDPADFDSLASIDVTTNGFTYTDEGLDDNTVYCYRVKTRGGYGNPKIKTPLENFSQVICAQPGDSIPPCKALTPVRLNFIDCEDYRMNDKDCDRQTFINTIFWNKPKDAECRNDISSYNVYAASKVGDVFTFIINIKDTIYKDENLSSFAKCYKVAAVDRSGNEGELSDALCIDNCPYYELPNVFTPNDDDLNDEFSAYSGRAYANCGETHCIPIEVAKKCARFVLRVKAKIYNRWGKEVYSYEGQISDDVKNIYIDWKGIDNNGNELASAVYYYVAEVTFDTVDPDQAVKTFKGWVHLLN